jgi:hypothetical protein
MQGEICRGKFQKFGGRLRVIVADFDDLNLPRRPRSWNSRSIRRRRSYRSSHWVFRKLALQFRVTLQKSFSRRQKSSDPGERMSSRPPGLSIRQQRESPLEIQQPHAFLELQ